MEIRVERKFLVLTYVIISLLSLSLGILIYPLIHPSEKEVILIPFKEKTTIVKTANIVAVSSSMDEGILGKVNVKIEQGKGKVLMETNPFIEPDTQYSAQIAKEVAEKFSGKSLRNYDVIYSFDIKANVLGGPSAGAAMTLATIAAIENKSVRSDAVITGTIEENGRIGKVGGIIEKAITSAKEGKKLFLVPEGQSKIVYYERVYEDQDIGFGFVIRNVRYVPKVFDLKKYMEEEYGLKVIEVSNIYDAAKIMLI